VKEWGERTERRGGGLEGLFKIFFLVCVNVAVDVESFEKSRIDEGLVSVNMQTVLTLRLIMLRVSWGPFNYGSTAG
jgi:hypothetical protein